MKACKYKKFPLEKETNSIACRVLQSIAEYYRVLQSITENYRESLFTITKYYREFSNCKCNFSLKSKKDCLIRRAGI